MPHTPSVLDKPRQLLYLLVLGLELLLQLGHLTLIHVLVEAFLVFLEHTVSHLLSPHLLDALFLWVVAIEVVLVLLLIQFFTDFIIGGLFENLASFLFARLRCRLLHVAVAELVGT